MSNPDVVPTELHFRDASGQSWTVPIPEDIQLDVAACMAMDQLRAGLTQVARTLAACHDTCHALRDVNPEVHAAYLQSLRQVEAAFDPTDASARALMSAVSKMLGL